MIVLHAFWHISGKLHLWAESSSLLATASGHGKKRSTKPNSHPFALPCDSLKDIAIDMSKDLTEDEIGPASLTVLLPSTRNQPLPSPELLCFNDVARSRGKRGATLKPWQITTLVLSAESALSFLFDLPDHPGRGVVLGSSLRFWAEAAKLSIELIARQCFLPRVRERQEDDSQRFRAVWEVVIEGEDRERLKRLADSMPPCCRAILYPAEEILPPDTLVQSFLNQTIDSFIRRSLSSESCS